MFVTVVNDVVRANYVIDTVIIIVGDRRRRDDGERDAGALHTGETTLYR